MRISSRLAGRQLGPSTFGGPKVERIALLCLSSPFFGRDRPCISLSRPRSAAVAEIRLDPVRRLTALPQGAANRARLPLFCCKLAGSVEGDQHRAPMVEVEKMKISTTATVTLAVLALVFAFVIKGIL